MAHDFAVKALYNAARRYCIDRTAEQSDSDAQSDEISAGVWLLNAILENIERALPEDFSRDSEVRDYLLSVGEKARVLEYHTEGTGEERRAVYYESPLTEVERLGLENARAGYIKYVTDLSVDQASQTEKVLYRHVMSDTKRRRVGKNLAERWGVEPHEHYWHPLMAKELPPDVLAFQEAWFRNEVGVESLQNILISKGIKRIWELDEFRVEPEYELDPRLCSFWKGVEGYWSSRELNWLIYVSHESSITFAGGWLIEAIKDVWPNWEKRIYTGWDYERPLDSV